MALLNYTTDVPVSRTLGHVQGLLVKAGAHRIAIDYADGEPSGVAFEVETPHGMRSYLLPVRSAAVLAVLQADGVKASYQTPQHAHRVAWRITKDWLEVQLAMLQADMVSLDQLMLPYLQVSLGRTLYDAWAEDQQLALGAG